MNSTNTKKSSVIPPQWRIRLHIWLGATLTLPLTLIALSGAGLAFAQEFERVLAPDLWTVSAVGEGQGMSLNSVMEHVHRWRPHDQLLSLNMPERPQDTIMATVKGPEGKVFELFIDPYRKILVGERPAHHDAVYWLGSIHRSLSSGPIGAVLVALSSISVILLFLLGQWYRRGHRNQQGSEPVVSVHRRLVYLAAWIWLICASTGLFAQITDQSLNSFAPPDSRLFASVPGDALSCTGAQVDMIWWQTDGRSLARCTAPGSFGPFGTRYSNGKQNAISLSFEDWLAAVHTGSVMGIGGRAIWFWSVVLLPVTLLSGLLLGYKRRRPRSVAIPSNPK